MFDKLSSVVNKVIDAPLKVLPSVIVDSRKIAALFAVICFGLIAMFVYSNVEVTYVDANDDGVISGSELSPVVANKHSVDYNARWVGVALAGIVGLSLTKRAIWFR